MPFIIKNMKGKIMRETHYYPFVKGKAIIRDYKNGITQCYCINTKGELLFKFPPHCWADIIEKDNVIFVTNHSDDNEQPYHALFDTNGKQLTEFAYKNIFCGVEEGFFETTKDGKCGHLSLRGEEVIPFIYEDSLYFQEGVAGMKLGGKWGMIDHKNETVVPFEYEEIGFSANNYISAKRNGKWGVIDKFNNVVIDFKFDELPYRFLGSRDCGSTFAKLGDKYGIIDVFGETLFDFVYDDLECADDDGRWYQFKKDGKWALYSCEKNCFVSSFMYDKIDFYERGFFKVTADNHTTYVDRENHPISDENFEYVDLLFGSDFICFKKDGKYGIMNTGGKIIIPEKYDDEFRKYSEGMFIMRAGYIGEYVMDRNENIVVPKRITSFFCGSYSDGLISIYDDGYYNKKGEKLELQFEL